MNTLGNLVPAVSLVLVGFVGCDPVLAMVFMWVSVSFLGCYTGAGGFINHLVISPKFAGELIGISDTISSTTGFIGPAVVGHLIGSDMSKQPWQVVFYGASAINVLGVISYFYFS